MQKLVLGGKFVNCNMHEKSKILQFFWRGGDKFEQKIIPYSCQIVYCIHPYKQGWRNIAPNNNVINKNINSVVYYFTHCPTRIAVTVQIFNTVSIMTFWSKNLGFLIFNSSLML